MSVDIVVVGHVGTEHVKTPESEAWAFGGAAYYAAIGARLQGATVGLVTSVGSDYPIDQLEMVGLDIKGIQVLPGDTTHFRITYLPTFEDRKVEVFLGVAEHFESISFPTYYLKAKCIHVATNLPQNQLDIIHELRKTGCNFISVDCFDQFIVDYPDIVVNCLNMSDLYFVNEKEERLLSNLPVKRDIKHIVKRGEKGAEANFGLRKIQTPSPKVNLVDPTGAGDIFAGAFLASYILGLDIETSMSKACKLASDKIKGFGISSLINIQTNTGEAK